MTNKYIHNVITDEIIIQEMNSEELAQRELEIAAWLAQKEAKRVEAAAKEAARQALLDKLGITAEEAQLLLGGK